MVNGAILTLRDDRWLPMKTNLIKKKKQTLKFLVVQIVFQMLGFYPVLAEIQRDQSIQSLKVSLTIQNWPVKVVLKEIESKTSLTFLYDEAVLAQKSTISGSYKDATVAAVLYSISEQTGLRFRQINNNVFVTSREEEVLASKAPPQEELIISGRVIDELSNEPLIGANVRVMGTSIGMVTDIAGNFVLKVPSGTNSVEVSFIGYLSEEVELNDRMEILVSLSPDIAALGEVMVIGYREVERKDATGSVASMNSEMIGRANKVDAFQSLQGQLAGVDIQSAGNKPGSGFYIRIRGNNTVNSSEAIADGGYSPGQNPLFVVDDVFVENISIINPADIERIDILKDASATAIYGSRGSSGVIIVTTKRGRAGGLTVNYENYFGFRQAYHLPRIFEGQEFVDFFKDAVVGTRHVKGDIAFTRNDVNLSDFLRPNEMENIRNNRFVNWPKLIRQNGYQMNHALSVSGGDDKVVYGFGAAYTRDQGTFPGEDLERYNMRANFSFSVTPLLTLGYSGYVTYSILNLGSQEGFRSAYRLRPTGDAYDETGEPLFFPLDGETFITNPLFEESGIIEETRALNYFGSFLASLNFRHGISLTSQFSPNLTYDRYGQFRGIYTKTASGNGTARRAYVDHSNMLSYSWDNILKFDNQIDDNHRMNAMMIISAWEHRNEWHQTEVRNFNSDEFLFYNQGAASDIRTLKNTLTKEALLSYTGRLEYAFRNKYVITATGRYDGASKLAIGNKWAFFPSAALAWRISEASFFKANPFVSNLKMRLSYGVTGNTGTGGGLRPLGSQSNIGFGFTNLGDAPAQTAYVIGLSNQELTWEKTAEINLGVDYGFVSNRINGSIDLYERTTYDLILPREIPALSGYRSVFMNVGEVKNKGIEMALNTVNVSSPDFKWHTSLNFAKNTNKLTELYDGLAELPSFSPNGGSYIHRVGEPVGAIYGYKFIGIWQMNELEQAQSFGQQPGQVRVKDIVSDGVINDEDRTIIGSLQPDWTGGIVNTLSYKNIDFSVFVYTRQGVMAHSWFHRSHAWDGDRAPGRFNGLKTNYWTPDNPSNEWFQPGNGGPYQDALLYQNVSYTRIGYLTLGFTFPKSLVNNMGIRNFRVYATAQNPFTFTSYDGWDPETAARNTYRASFLSRTLLAGVNVRF
jgi:TonB-dependent starch-binding outer membrane protein SusC